MVIWIILLFVLPNCLKSKFDTDKEFASNTTSIIIDNNKRFVNQLETSHNKIVNSYQQEIINQKESRKDFIILLLTKKYSSNKEINNEKEKRIENLAEKLLGTSNEIILKYIDESENLVELDRRL